MCPRSAEAKRERGLISWLNSEVATVEAASAGLDSGCTTGVGVRRLLGEVGGKAYLYFKRDASFAAAAAKVESKIAARHLALKDVVRGADGWGAIIAGADQDGGSCAHGRRALF